MEHPSRPRSLRRRESRSQRGRAARLTTALAVAALLAPAVVPAAPPASIDVSLADVATIPASSGSNPLARINLLREAPDGSGRWFVNDLRGPFQVIDGGTIQEYMDLADEFPNLKTSPGLASGFVSFAFDPEFASNGLFYTVHSETVGAVAPNLGPALPIAIVQHAVLTEWTATMPAANSFSGTSREVLRIASPHHIHNLGEIAFNPLATSSDPDYRLLYIAGGDYATTLLGDPDQLQRLDTPYGALLRIDPRGAGHQDYTVPSINPFATDGDPDTFGEIYAYGFRNGHRMSWDPDTGDLYVTDVGQDHREEIDRITAGTNYGWPYREGDKRIDPLGDLSVVFDLTQDDLDDDDTFGYTYPVALYDHPTGDAIAGGFPIRNPAFPALDDRFVFGDIVSGELWYAELADMLAADDGDPATMATIGPVDLDQAGTPTTLLDLVRTASGDPGASRTDLRLGLDAEGRLYLTTKQDGVIRYAPEPSAWLQGASGLALLGLLARRRQLISKNDGSRPVGTASG